MPPGEMELLNEVYTMSTAISPTIIVNQCQTAGEKLGLDTSGCITDNSLKEQEIPFIEVRSKIINRYF